MMTWVTVWVLTVTQQPTFSVESESKYQLSFATQKICNRQGRVITNREGGRYTCNFQQTPIYLPQK